jgi:hypothetical protein
LYDWAAQVYVGDDSTLPLGSGFVLAIRATLDASGKPIKPRTIEAALLELKKAVWLQNALIGNNDGGHGCLATMELYRGKQINYLLTLQSWYWINWDIASKQSPLGSEFARLNLYNETDLPLALNSGFCEYLKSGDMKKTLAAIAYIAKQ